MYLDVWRSGKFLEKMQVSTLLIVNTDRRTFLGFRKLLYSCTERTCHSSTHPGMSLHVTQFYQALPHDSTASAKRWGEKAWVRGYLVPRSQAKLVQSLGAHKELDVPISFGLGMRLWQLWGVTGKMGSA